MQTANKRFALFLITGAVLLSIPFVAMQFSNEVNWSLSDFAFMGGLILLLILAVETVLRTVKRTLNRLLLLAFAVSLFLFVWAELAVGIIGSPFAGS